MKQVFGASQQRSAAVPIGAGVALLGAGIYYKSRSKPQVSEEQARRDRAQAKRDEGLSGAGVGGNAVTGGHELSHVNPQRSEGSTAPLEKLPSGGVGGGVGAGGANVRSIEMTAKQRGGTTRGWRATMTGRPRGGTRRTTISTSLESGQSLSQTLQGAFGQGGKRAAEPDDQNADFHNTKIASNHAETPTKRAA
ncbi:hypothetical protein LRP88_07602 [Fusarium phalaenopsidis]